MGQRFHDQCLVSIWVTMFVNQNQTIIYHRHVSCTEIKTNFYTTVNLSDILQQTLFSEYMHTHVGV